METSTSKSVTPADRADTSLLYCVGFADTAPLSVTKTLSKKVLSKEGIPLVIVSPAQVNSTPTALSTADTPSAKEIFTVVVYSSAIVCAEVV